MPNTNLNDPPTDPKLGRRPPAPLSPFIVPVLLALLIVILGYLALGLRSSINAVDRRMAKIETALGGLPAAETFAKGQPAEPPAAPETRSADSKAGSKDLSDSKGLADSQGLSDSLNVIKEQVAAIRVQVDAIRGSIADLQKFARTAKDPPPAGFASDEMLVAQKGLIVKTPAPGGSVSGGTRAWLATPSHDMLDLLLKIPPSKSFQILTFTPKQKNQVKSIDVYDRNSKGAAGRVANCQTENKQLRCKLNVLGPTVLQVVAKTQGDEPLDIELEPAS